MMCSKRSFDKCGSDHLPEPMSSTTKEQLFAYEKCVWDCFDSNVLDFVNSSQTIQYGDRTDLTVKVKTVTKGPDGTLPKGSVWREAPIPDLFQISSSQADHGRCTWDAIDESTFSSDEARAKFIASFGDRDSCDSGPDQHYPRNWHIKDMVQVPPSLPSGEYLLMWRWECGLANQIWSNCADVQVVDASIPSTTLTTETTSTTSGATALISTTTTTSVAHCLDSPLPDAWTGGGVHNCSTYKQLSLAYCDHTVLQIACCFCGGGGPEPEPEPEPEPTTSTAAPPPCTDAQLPLAWSGGGSHTCSTYEQHGGLAYCAHQELAEACCFCNAGRRLSQISRARIPALNFVATASLLISTACSFHL